MVNQITLPAEQLDTSSTISDNLPEPNEAVVEALKQLIKQGKFFTAWLQMAALSPVETWAQSEWQLAVIPVLERLSDKSRAKRILWKLWREKEKLSWELREAVSWQLLNYRGFLRTLEWRRMHPILELNDARKQSDEFVWEAYLLAGLRDFSRADQALIQAEQVDPENYWLWMVRGLIESWQDRHESALVHLKKAYELNPCSVGVIHSLESTHLALGQDDEAKAILRDGVERLEATSLATSLHQLQLELEDYDAAAESLALAQTWSPFMREGDEVSQWFAARRCDLACRLGDYEGAAKEAQLVKDSEFYQSMAKRLSGDLHAFKRHVLPVGFVRQHRMTCVPATLTVLAKYWSKEVSHLETAEAICYDGTPYHSQRTWAEQQGWAVREFKITEASLKTLIDQGLPFALSTVDPGSAHCQAVIGYDEFRGVMLVRDSNSRSKVEFLLEEGLKSQASSGPRGFVMVPLQEASRLTGLELPESEFYDLYHRLQVHLEKHERQLAGEALEALERLNAEHRITWQAKDQLAHYDRDLERCLEATEALHRLYPDEVNTQLRRFGLMSSLRPLERVLAELKVAVEKPGSSVLLWAEYARQLAGDGRYGKESGRWYQRCRRVRLDAWSLHGEANAAWEAQAYERATELYRFAACLDDHSHGLCMSYFSAAKWIHRGGEALDWLKKRYEAQGHLSSLPAQAYSEALMSLGRFDEGLQVLAEQQLKRPEDTEWVLYRATELLKVNHLAQAKALLESLESTSTRETSRQRLLAQIATREHEVDKALEIWDRILEREPLALDAHGAIADLKSMKEGLEAAVAHFDQATDRFPHHLGLHQYHVGWARRLNLEVEHHAVEKLLQHHPHDAEAKRDLANVLVRLQKYDEALELVEAQIRVEPKVTWNHSLKGWALMKLGRRVEAREAFQQALRLSIENGPAMALLLDSSADEKQRHQDLEFLKKELKRQFASGEAIAKFTELAMPYLSSQELETLLVTFYRDRSELWQVGLTLLQVLTRAQKWSEAKELAETLKGRFPLLANVWCEIGQMHGANAEHEAAIEALRQSVDLSPSWAQSSQKLALMYLQTGRGDLAKAVIQQALKYDPLNVYSHGYHAECLRIEGSFEAAISALKQALQLDPSYGYAWNALQDFSEVVGRPEVAQQFAKRLLEKSPNDAISWWNYANTLLLSGQLEERLGALDRVFELNPTATYARAEKVRLLVSVGRIHDALAACQDAQGHDLQDGELMFQKAKLLMEIGRAKEAIQQMNDALQIESAMPEAWRVLAEWYQHQEEWPQAERAIKHVMRLEPNDARNYGIMGDLKRDQGDAKGAIEAYRSALRLDPSESSVALRLFAVYCRNQEFDEAETLLQQKASQLTTLYLETRYAILRLRQGRYEESYHHFSKMAACPEDHAPQFELLAQILLEDYPSLVRSFERHASQSLTGKEINPQVGAFLAKLKRSHRSLISFRDWKRIPTKTELATRALSETLSALGDLTNQGRIRNIMNLPTSYYFHRLMKRYGDWMRQDDELWGMVGYFYFVRAKTKKTLTWMSDWKEREHLKLYMLNNLAMACQTKGDFKQYREVIQFAIQRPVQSLLGTRFKLWAALEDALAGNHERAQKGVEFLDHELMRTFEQSLYRLVKLVNRMTAKPGSVPLNKATKRVLNHFAHGDHDGAYGTHVVREVCRIIGKQQRSVWPRIWAWFATIPSRVKITLIILAMLSFKIFAVTMSK